MSKQIVIVLITIFLMPNYLGWDGIIVCTYQDTPIIYSSYFYEI